MIGGVFSLTFAVVLFFLAFEKPGRALVLMVLATFCFPTYFSNWAYLPLGFRIFFLDVVLLSLFMQAIISRKFRFNDGGFLNRPWLLWFIYGMFSLMYSILIQHHHANDIIGFFRRFVFYPIVVYYVMVHFLRLMSRESIRRLLRRLYLLPLFSILTQAMVRVSLQHGYHGQAFAPPESPDDFRGTSHVEALAALPAFHYSLHRLIQRESKPLSFDGVVVILGILISILSGFRIIMITYAVSILLHVIFVMIRRRANVFSFLFKFALILLLVVGIVSVVGVKMMPGIVEQQISNMTQKLISSETGGLKIEGIGWRLTLWAHNVNEFLKSPLIGQGIGYQSDWIFGGEKLQNDPHNILLTVGVRLGIVGLLLFLYIHLRYFRAAFRAYLSTEEPGLLLPLLLFYISVFIVGMLQPGPFGPHGASMLSMTMALTSQYHSFGQRKMQTWR